jgi:hypothetical protein
VLGDKMDTKQKNILTAVVLIAIAATIYAFAVMRVMGYE